jgi:histidyl-tRNA synthetase
VALTTPRTMPGVMELLPLEQVAFQRFLDAIRQSYERFGFVPIETPAIELRDVLLTKTGGETERQVYYVQSTGSLEQGGAPELALRFDLTVPLARYVAEHEAQLSFPFRRYQMQRVYRGESAQRGRFREFYQCDIDVVGKDTLSVRYDAEMPAVIHSVFRDLGIGPFTIRLNNRKLLRALFPDTVSDEQRGALMRAVDKADKRGDDWVREQFGDLRAVADRILGVRMLRHADALEALKAMPGPGADEMAEVLRVIQALGVPEERYVLDLSIARGLDYYTGTVYETTLDDAPHIGSICSGGRYDDLAGHYTKSRLPGVGISIGATRLFYQLGAAKLLPAAQSTIEVLVTRMDEGRLADDLALATELRAADLNTEVVLDAGKLGKQMKYADRAGIRFALVVGSDEAAAGVVTVKDLRAQAQTQVPRAEVAARLRAALGR